MCRLAVILLAFAAAVAAPACSRRAERSASSKQALSVFAASSLREAFTRLAPAFEAAHPGVEIHFNFAGSQELHAQIEHGAPADVFASADRRHMDALAQAGQVMEPVVFARNEPVIVVGRAQAKLRGLSDLPQLERIVLGAKEVPIGRYAEEILARADARLGGGFRQRVLEKVVSRELNVRQVLAKVALGEAEAGIVYRSDVKTAKGDLSEVAIPSELNVIAEYPAAVVRGAPHATLARAFVALLSSREGRAALTGAGFLEPVQVGRTP